MNLGRITERVAREIVSARVIRLDKSAIRKEAKEIQSDVIRFVKSHRKDDEPLGKYLENFSILVEDVDGDIFPVTIVVRSRPSKSRELATGGGAGKSAKTGLPAIVVVINASITSKVYILSGKLETQMYNLLIHELTHIADKYRKKMKVRREVPKEDELDPVEYYNDPSEVKAYMQEVVTEAPPNHPLSILFKKIQSHGARILRELRT